MRALTALLTRDSTLTAMLQALVEQVCRKCDFLISVALLWGCMLITDNSMIGGYVVITYMQVSEENGERLINIVATLAVCTEPTYNPTEDVLVLVLEEINLSVLRKVSGES